MSSTVSPGNDGTPNRSNQIWVCDSPSNRIEPTPSAMITTSARVQPGSRRPLRERPPADAALLVGEGEGREPAEQPEPDREHLGVRAPGVAPELRHHREGVGGVADQDDEQGLRAGVEHELDPDDDHEADRRRPSTEPLRVVGDLPGRDAEAPDERRTEIVEGRERVQEVPDRAR